MLVFISFALIGLLLTLVSSFFGHDFELHPELEVGGIGFVSIRAFAIFLTAFGTVGALARWYGSAPLACSLWGAGVGVLMYGFYILAMTLVRSQQASSLIQDQELLGLTGTVTIAIPADGVGEVTCRLKSQTTRRTARSAQRQPIAIGSLVKVSRLQGDELVVEPAGT